jgi:hypothetical protein
MHSRAEYDRELSRQYPGLFVILLDQSASMEQQIEGSNTTKASIATMHVNAIIQKMIDFAGVDEYTGKHKNYAYLSILGYNDDVYPLLSQDDRPLDIVTLDDCVRGVVPFVRDIRNRAGQVVRRVTEKKAFWVEPRAQGNTEMVRAFERAGAIVHNWLNSPPEFISKELGMQMARSQCFPPIIINITDAKHNGEGRPEDVAEDIRSLRTDNGNVLICNCHLTNEKAQSCRFPIDISEVEHLGNPKLVTQMFRMSSIIPEVLRQRAQKIMRTPVGSGSRCFIYNADPDTLIQFLRWGTLGNVGIGGR